jgi:hypothetical protein
MSKKKNVVEVYFFYHTYGTQEVKDSNGLDGYTTLNDSNINNNLLLADS